MYSVLFLTEYIGFLVRVSGVPSLSTQKMVLESSITAQYTTVPFNKVFLHMVYDFWLTLQNLAIETFINHGTHFWHIFISDCFFQDLLNRVNIYSLFQYAVVG